MSVPFLPLSCARSSSKSCIEKGLSNDQINDKRRDNDKELIISKSNDQHLDNNYNLKFCTILFLQHAYAKDNAPAFKDVTDFFLFFNLQACGIKISNALKVSSNLFSTIYF